LTSNGKHIIDGRVVTAADFKAANELPGSIIRRIQVAPKMKRSEAMALAKQLGAALDAAQKLYDKYGEDHEPGTVIRFTKQFANSSWDAFPLTEDRRIAMEQAMTYHYAAIRAQDGQWYVTGNSSAISNTGVEWEELIDFLDEGVPVNNLEVWPVKQGAIDNGDKVAEADERPGA